MSSHLRDFGMVSSTLWNSDRFTSLENLRDRMAYIWLHCSQKTSAGVLRLGPAHMADELDFIDGMDEAEAVFDALEATGLIIRQRPFIIITKFLRFNPVKSYRHAIAAWKEVLSLQGGEPKTNLYRELKTQKGTIALIDWRDKSGEPHDVIFDMQQFAFDVDDWADEPFPNPSDSPPEPMGSPSGKPILKPINEKRESRPPLNTQNSASSSDVGLAENRPKPLGPLPTTIEAARRIGAL